MRFDIKGGRRLSGEIKVAGNKNSILPIMAACLLTDQPCILENVPKISDVSVLADLLEKCGAKVKGIGSSKLTIDCKNIKSATFPSTLTEKLRASVLLLGPMLARAGSIKMGYPGGDVIGRRPLTTHIQALTSLGATIKEDDDFFQAKTQHLKGTEVFLQEASVTATENVLMAASLIDDQTVIKRAASEPHVVDLCNFLAKLGVEIRGIGSDVLKIRGKKQLSGATHTIRPDHLEVGTFAICAAITKGTVRISPIIKEDLDMILLVLGKFGVNFKIEDGTLIVADSKLKAVEKVVVDIWPGFPTDLMAPMIVLATQAEGATILHDWMYESRMFFVDKLLSMGAKVVIADPHRVLVYGPTNLRGQKLDTPDIRAGIALVIAALAAKGKSSIERAELVERGYEDVVQRLTNLGAEIKKLE